jgi:capsular exopolysaccharide synthesis family protein
MGNEEVDALVQFLKHPSRVEAGADIVYAEQSAGYSTLLLSGVACSYKRSESGIRLIYSFQYPGEFCDLYRYLLPEWDETLAVQALAECSIATIAYSEIKRLLVQRPRLRLALWRATVLEASILRQWLSNARRGSAVQRVANLLCEQLVRLEAIGIAGPVLPVTQDMIKRRRIYAIPDVLSSPIIQQLRIEEARANARLANSASMEGPKHPDRKALDSEAARLRESIDSNVNQIVSNLEANAKDARAREEELASKVQSLGREVGDASQQQLQLSILERRAEGRRTFYAALEKRHSETSALMHGVYPDARIVSRATPQPLPSWPNTHIVLASGLVLGTAFGAAIVALLALADRTFRTPMQLEEASGLACLGVLPELGRARHRASGGTLFNRSTRMFRESIRTIQVGLDAAMGAKSQNQGRVILVTSALPQEGKTVSSVALATALAASGSKTLLIDADLRRPAVGAHLAGLSRSPTLESMLADGEEYLAAAEIDKNLYAIRSGGVDEDAQQVFLTTRFGEFVEKARAEFDSIVIDSPPAMVVADAAILARFADVVLHVVRWGRTRRTAVIDSVDRMHRANSKAAGVTMLNRATPAQYFKYNRDGGWSFRYASYYRPAITTAASKRQ